MGNNMPFPQADDFDKIVALVNIVNEEDLNNNEKVKVVLGEISERQISYYISASSFLGIILTQKRKRKFTNFGNHLRRCNSVMQEIELITAILRLPVFSKVYVLNKIVGTIDSSEVADMIKENYGEAICERRAQTVLKWVEWVIEKIN